MLIYKDSETLLYENWFCEMFFKIGGFETFWLGPKPTSTLRHRSVLESLLRLAKHIAAQRSTTFNLRHENRLEAPSTNKNTKFCSYFKIFEQTNR